jgi:hypothetical protein
MQTITIIGGGRSSFPAQATQLVSNSLTIRTTDGGKIIYPVTNSIRSLSTISEL